MENTLLYNRQQELNLHIPDNVCVAGCGGIGGNAAIELAMVGVKMLYLFDPDTLEESNRARLPFCQGSLNKPKVEVVRDYIECIRPDCLVVAVNAKLEGVFLEIQLGVSRWILDCTDSPRSQFTIYKACKAKGVNYVRAGYDGEHMTVTSNISGWVKSVTADGEEQANYTVNPSCRVTAMMPALLAVWKIIHSPNQEVSCDVSDIGVEVLMKQERPMARCHQAGSDRTETRGGVTARIRTGRNVR